MSAVLPTYSRYALEVSHGEGVTLVATSGERYLDFAGGIAVNVLGHAHPRLVAALTEQAGRLWHTSNLYRIPGQERLAERLCAASFADLAFFTNSGAEAIECSLKMARRYHHVSGAPERYRIVTFEGSFHGRTLATIAAAKQKKLVDGFGPMMDGFDQVPFGDLAALEAAIGPETAGILIEPIQGEGGIRVVPAADLAAMRTIADRHGVLLLLDEVQCGMGRTGRLFAHEWAGITPDILASAKGIGGGFPLGACLATAEAAKGMTAGTHGSTYGGNPLAMAVGNAVLDVLLEPGFLEEVVRKGQFMRQGLAALEDAYGDVIAEVRGQGLMLGLKLHVPNGEFIGAMLGEHILAVPAGENVVRLLPPLIVGEDEMREALARIERACKASRAARAATPPAAEQAANA
ncbi:MAG: acetylornithine/succinylornithine family transaminase [Rhizobiales bacterium]|nr:acetylornithine/succinylornithine family transaminase [Hyphomicrobiales bacterium]